MWLTRADSADQSLFTSCPCLERAHQRLSPHPQSVSRSAVSINSCRYLPSCCNNNNGHPTPSALFAKWLMHNCAVELVLPPLTSFQLLSASPLPPSPSPPFIPNPSPNWNAWYRSDPWSPSSSPSSSRQWSLETEPEDELKQRRTRTTLPRHQRITDP